MPCFGPQRPPHWPKDISRQGSLSYFPVTWGPLREPINDCYSRPDLRQHHHQRESSVAWRGICTSGVASVTSSAGGGGGLSRGGVVRPCGLRRTFWVQAAAVDQGGVVLFLFIIFQVSRHIRVPEHQEEIIPVPDHREEILRHGWAPLAQPGRT